MKDRFRFRAWNEIGKYYLYDVQNSIYSHNRQRYTFVDAVNKGLLKSWKLEQCTGLKDKNGKLIYEGDVVRLDEWFGEATAYIKYEKYSSCYKLKNKHDSCLLSLFTSDEMEIIGNIHENPELLEEK